MRLLESGGANGADDSLHDGGRERRGVMRRAVREVARAGEVVRRRRAIVLF